MQACVWGPLAAGQLEEIAETGCRKFLACGSCGVLQKDIAVGRFIVPTAAVRDEGTSYHYARPSREIAADERIMGIIEEKLPEENIPFIKAKTWTTDAMFRETPGKIALRKTEGCVSVEMEASVSMAVAQYLGVDFGQILYSGDGVGGNEWDTRDYNKRTDIREFLLGLTPDICLKM